MFHENVETNIKSIEGIADVAVIGVPSERWGEAVKAILVLSPDANFVEKEFIAYAKTKIAGYKCPKSVDIVNVLPRNASGKVLRRQLREPYWKNSERQVS